MPHPDEGMIHSWLDGALPAEDAANIESHVAGCEQCRAAVAEARGFIAASSRILTALDDVPGDVIPVVPARRRDLRVFWRAAAMLVVAGGSLIVLRESGQDTAVRMSTDSTTASLESAAPTAAGNSTLGEGAAIAEDATASVQQSKTIVPSPRRAAPTTAVPDRSKATVGRASTNEQDFSGKASDARIAGTVAGAVMTGIAADMAAPPPSTPAGAAEPRTRAEGTSLKPLSVERRIGEIRTTYQVAPTETVMLIESQALALSVMTTGASAQQRTRGESPMAAQAAAPPAPRPTRMLVDSQRGRDSVTLSKKSAVAAGKLMQLMALPIVVVRPNSISWTEAATGNRLTLSGNVSVERLEEIKLSIEQERAATRARVP